MQIDTTTEFGARVARRLRDGYVIWLTTVRADGTPQPSPVWFLWDGERFLIFSQPATPKVRNIERSPSVALSFDGDGRGSDIIVFTGQAHIADDAPGVDGVPAYVEKYGQGISSLGMTPEQMAASYSTAIFITPTGLRGF